MKELSHRITRSAKSQTYENCCGKRYVHILLCNFISGHSESQW